MTNEVRLAKVLIDMLGDRVDPVELLGIARGIIKVLGVEETESNNE